MTSIDNLVDLAKANSSFIVLGTVGKLLKEAITGGKTSKGCCNWWLVEDL